MLQEGGINGRRNGITCIPFVPKDFFPSQKIKKRLKNLAKNKESCTFAINNQTYKYETLFSSTAEYRHYP